ncbi:MAG: hypothetical protein AAF316_00335 [Cyanobacteria bacterium P01_A01_bin.80]
MNAQELRKEFEEILMGIIGTYDFQTKKIPSIWVGTLETEVVKEGLEVLIPITGSFKRYGNRRTREWEITLVQNPSQVIQIDTAIERLSKINNVTEIKSYPLSQESKTPSFAYLDFAEVTWCDWVTFNS